MTSDAGNSPSSTGGFSFLRHTRRVLRLALLAFGLFLAVRIVGCLLTYTPPKPLPGTEESVPQSKRAVWNGPPEQPLPDNGYGVFRFDRAAADSTLRIQPRGEQGHIVVKVEDFRDARLVCWLFIRQGEAVETRIPSGSYRLKLACGRQWYGETHLFGPGASYSAILNEISIPIRATYTVDLHPSAAGTLRESTVRVEDF